MNGYTFYYPVMFANKYIKFLAPYIHDWVLIGGIYRNNICSNCSITEFVDYYYY